MENSEKHTLDPETAVIRRLIAARLRARVQDESKSEPAGHLDDDAIAVFVEGRLEEAESAAIVSHLVACPSCLHMTAQLIRLDPEIDDVSSASMPAEEPGPLRRLFDRVAAGLIPSVGEDSVFAYRETEEPANKENQAADQKSDKERDGDA